MTKFKCVKSTSSGKYSPQVGVVLEGELVHVQREYGVEARINLLKDSDHKDVDGKPYWSAGESIPLKGSIWIWEEVK